MTELWFMIYMLGTITTVSRESIQTVLIGNKSINIS